MFREKQSSQVKKGVPTPEGEQFKSEITSKSKERRRKEEREDFFKKVNASFRSSYSVLSTYMCSLTGVQ